MDNPKFIYSMTHREVHDLYKEAHTLLSDAWSDSIDENIYMENARLIALKTAAERLLKANLEKIDYHRAP